jgi:serine/threonine-protein kinase
MSDDTGPLSESPTDPTVRAAGTSGASGQPGSAPLPPEAGPFSADAANWFGKHLRTTKLGSGGGGEVWRAYDTVLGRWVALKLLKGTDEEEVVRFHREAQLAGRLSHPNIAAIYEVGSAGGRFYIAMQLVDGRTLRALGADARRAATLLRDAARAVAYAHEEGVIHRDLKPDNLMVAGGSHVYVMDFGLARAVSASAGSGGAGGAPTLSGVAVGTPSYMAPEQAGSAPTAGPTCTAWARRCTSS